jgi:hypothetical protein
MKTRPEAVSQPDFKLGFTAPSGSDMLLGYLANNGIALAGGGIVESSGDASDKILLSPNESTVIHLVGTIKRELTEARDQAKIEKAYPSRTDGSGQILSSLDYGNHFYTSNNGKRWHWKSGDNVSGGNLNCGQNNSWYYDVRVGAPTPHVESVPGATIGTNSTFTTRPNKALRPAAVSLHGEKRPPD